MLRNVDAKHTSVSALPVNPFRMSTANDIMSVRQPATGEKCILKTNDEVFFLRGGIFLLKVFSFVSCILGVHDELACKIGFRKRPPLGVFNVFGFFL